MKETALSETDILSIDQDISDRFTVTDFPQFAGKPILEFIQEKENFTTGDGLLLQWAEDIAGGTLELEFMIKLKLSDGKEFIFENEIMKIK